MHCLRPGLNTNAGSMVTCRGPCCIWGNPALPASLLLLPLLQFLLLLLLLLRLIILLRVFHFLYICISFLSGIK